MEVFYYSNKKESNTDGIQEIGGVGNVEHLEKLLISAVAVKATEAELPKSSDVHIILLHVPKA